MVQKDLTIVNENVLYVPRYQISDQISKRNTSGKKRRKRTEKVEAVGYQNVKATLSLNGRVLKLMGLNKDLQEETLKLVKSHFTKKK